jgi:regulator of protease activity HflC (stomatin/prohibitin superfamily)
MKNESIIKPLNGYLFFFIFLLTISLTIFFASHQQPLLAIIGGLSTVFLLKGFFIVNPNKSMVMVLFGKYAGTVKENGFSWTNPFYRRISISLRARNFDSERLKVNDKVGNPILISVILVWKVEDTYKAAFDVDDYQYFVRIQTDAAVRKLAGRYPYDNFDDDQAELTLRSGMDVINDSLEEELKERLEIAGIEVLEARIGYLAYAPEIAGAMLKRQQATAIVAARFKIVEGAVGMVETALEELSKKEIITLDEDKKATMVSNLMVVLCGDRDASPVINTGTLVQ